MAAGLLTITEDLDIPVNDQFYNLRIQKTS